MRFVVVSQDLKGITLVQDFKTLICMNSDFPKVTSMLYMILTQLTKITIFKILLQTCGKFCEFLLLQNKFT